MGKWKVQGDSAAGGMLLLGVATFLLLFCSISAPIIDTVRMFRLVVNINGYKRYADFGIWGYCVPPIKTGKRTSLPNFDPSVIEGCSKSSLGYTVGSVVASSLRAPALETALSKVHTAALVLVPVATGLAFIAFVLSVSVFFTSRSKSIGAPAGVKTITGIFIFNSFATLVSIIAFVVQITVVATIKGRISKIRATNGNLTLNWDNMIWLMVIAIICQIMNMVVLFSTRNGLVAHEKHEQKTVSKTSRKNNDLPPLIHDKVHSGEKAYDGSVP
ncbi:SUR7/PalI family-domain-containing protein [Crucibulum laeve]|uniref:SUR7/PalI family-domain-containing protein n=1 Tax=Crucibulum laeve TaxID=68775 RepID=A0A5C3M4U8_9AGAR|nr:SUR7/PalI family-domain-containing protein [Crucibulum laeve]